MLNTIDASITSNGIETPLGVLSVAQVEKGEAILQEGLKIFQTTPSNHAALQEFSSKYYTAIPHKWGRQVCVTY